MTETKESRDIDAYGIDYLKIWLLQKFLHYVDLSKSSVDITMIMDSEYTDSLEEKIRELWKTDRFIVDDYVMIFSKDPDTKRMIIRVTDLCDD
jgi:hypothetical protein